MISIVKNAETATSACVALIDLSAEDVDIAGGKGANLGELLRAGVPVPPGFVVMTSAFEAFAKEIGLDAVVRDILDGVDTQHLGELDAAAAQIRREILAGSVPTDVAGEIAHSYDRLGGGAVAVRSSSTAEDSLDASFAGQHRTFLNVESAPDVIAAVLACWASLYEARAIFYRNENCLAQDNQSFAVCVQQMAPADVSGVMFTVDPTGNHGNSLLIEAVFGLGEPLASGELSPDAYVVDRETLRPTTKELSRQPWMLSPDRVGTGVEAASGKTSVDPARQWEQKLHDARIAQLAELGLRLERHYGRPQDVEWAWADDMPYILQSRAVTTVAPAAAVPAHRNGALPPLVSGAAASPGVVSGKVRIIASANEIEQIEVGDVVVTDMTTPDFVPAMKRAAAIVTNRGGRTCHAAIVSRELGLPCVVGTGDATEVLRDIPTVTVDGGSGNVYRSDIADMLSPPETAVCSSAPVATRTKLYVNLADPDAASRVAALDVDGVGLLRAEFMIAHLGEHPRAMLESGRGDEFTRHLADGLEAFASAFEPRPVVYRFSDFKTNEYRSLKGGEAFEPHEENPMIGYRGSARYLADPDLFDLEIQALLTARRRFSNLWAMVPFVRTTSELRSVISALARGGLERSAEFKVWMMAEVPSNVLLLDQFIDEGVDGVSIGSNDLTQLILGVDRDSERLAETFDERDPAVLQAIEHVIRTCSKRDISVSICGQAPSVYPELMRQLVEWGITSVSVTPDMIEGSRLTLVEAERSLQTSAP